MRSLLLATTAVAILCSSAYAAPKVHLSGVLSSVAEADFPDAVMLKAAPYDTIAFDDKSFLLTKVTMSDIASQFGGKLQKLPNENGARQEWLCYDDAGTRTWFYSDAEGRDPVVTLIAEELATTPAAASGCSDVSAALVPVAGDLPGVGAKLQDLVARFGTATPDADGHLSFSFVADTSVQSVLYIVRDGVVTSIAFSQWSIG